MVNNSQHMCWRILFFKRNSVLVMSYSIVGAPSVLKILCRKRGEGCFHSFFWGWPVRFVGHKIYFVVYAVWTDPSPNKDTESFI